jgi:hypothetical protein
MARKRPTPEEIVAKLRQVDGLVSTGEKRGGCSAFDRNDRGDVLSLWTALPLQADFELICLASCKHLSGVTRRRRGAQMGNPLAYASAAVR